MMGSYNRHRALHVYGEELETPAPAFRCFNCDKPCHELKDVPEFDYKGCQVCYDEALAILAAEAAEALAALAAYQERKRIEPMQARLLLAKEVA